MFRAIVLRVVHAIFVNIEVAAVSGAVTVVVSLIRVGHIDTIIAQVPKTIEVDIVLLWVCHRRAIILVVLHAVPVGVTACLFAAGRDE